MAKKKKVNWSAWIRYYIGRALQIFGMLLVTWAMFMFFGSSQMRPMLAVTGAGAAVLSSAGCLPKTIRTGSDESRRLGSECRDDGLQTG